MSPDSYANEPTSGNNSGNMPMPKNGAANDGVDNGSNDRRNSIYGINPANGGASNAPVSADEKDDQDTAGDVDQMSRPRSRSTAGQGTRNPGRPGADPAPTGRSGT